jgi:CheY-like chemotaxis protein
VVDEDRGTRIALTCCLRDDGHPVWFAEHGGRAVELYRLLHHEIDLIILDAQLPGLDGPATLSALREIDPAVRCCLMTRAFTGCSREQLLAAGACLVVPKPVDWPALRSLLGQGQGGDGKASGAVSGRVADC